jgi:hypothetical protein
MRTMAKKLLHIINGKDEIISTISFDTKKDLALFAKEIKTLNGLGYRLAVSELNV